MAKTKETKMFPEQQEKMTQEVMASLQSSLEVYQQTFLQVPRIDDRKPVFVSSDV